jgi:Glutathione S-transferase, N-terminal domain
MASSEPLVNFYDISGKNPWSPFCWPTRYTLNYKGIPYKTTKLSYPAIKPTCKKLFPDMTGLEATAPIIEILGSDYKALNDSTPIAKLLNERFTEEKGYKHLKDVEKLDGYKLHPRTGIFPWIIYDVYANALDPSDGSREFFKETREARLKCDLSEVTDKKGGGEKAVWEELKKGWAPLKERMKDDDGNVERESSGQSFEERNLTHVATFLDFYDAAHLKW